MVSIKTIQKTSNAKTTIASGRKIEYIVIHYTAGSTSRAGSAENVASMFANTAVEASADYIVDDTTVVQYNPNIRNRYTWHCGDSKAYTKGGSFYGICTNPNSIGIEICSTNNEWSSYDRANSPKWKFTDTAIANALELTKSLMKSYSIPPERVIRHYDVSGKLCPGIIGWNTDSGDESQWLKFKSKLTSAEQPKISTGIIYRVRTAPDNAKSQIGAWKNLDSAKSQADRNPGYCVYDTSGRLIYSPKKSADDVVKEVIAGKWGNGEQRRKLLIAAGYDYYEIQNKVNNILK